MPSAMSTLLLAVLPLATLGFRGPFGMGPPGPPGPHFPPGPFPGPPFPDDSAQYFESTDPATKDGTTCASEFAARNGTNGFEVYEGCFRGDQDFLANKPEGYSLRICQEKWDTWTFFEGTVQFLRIIADVNQADK